MFHTKRNFIIAQKMKTKSKKIVDRLTYNPLKHKHSVTKTLQANLQKKKITEMKQIIPSPKIKFSSFNVNGLDIEAAWAVEQLLTKRGFDVSHLNELKIKHYTHIPKSGPCSERDSQPS